MLVLRPGRSASEKHQGECDSSEASQAVHRPFPYGQTMKVRGPPPFQHGGAPRRRDRRPWANSSAASEREAPGRVDGSGGGQAKGMWSIEAQKSEGERTAGCIAASVMRPRAGSAAGSCRTAVAWQTRSQTVRSLCVGSQQPSFSGAADTCRGVIAGMRAMAAEWQDDFAAAGDTWCGLPAAQGEAAVATSRVKLASSTATISRRKCIWTNTWVRALTIAQEAP